jgi:Fe-S oxidoreductase
MNTMLRYTPGQQPPNFKTYFRYQNQNVLQHAEQCNGSGDCRKSHLMGGTMCPSYMATRNEKDTTRARANMLRTFLTQSDKVNRFDHEEIKQVMDLCLSCKGCKSECPSNVDMAKLKAEFLQHYQDANGVPLRSRLIASYAASARLGAIVPGLYNLVMTQPFVSSVMKQLVGFAPQRSMPALHRFTLQSWYKKHIKERQAIKFDKDRVYLFCDEFTNYQDTTIGIKAILLLERLGYEVTIPEHNESGRAHISKGLLRKAKQIAHRNIDLLSSIITDATPLIGVEPSAILTFRDEYPDLVDNRCLQAAQQLAKRSFLIDEFLAAEMQKGNILPEQFKDESRVIKLHGHCQQKAWSALSATQQILSLPANYRVENIPSGCCGMAGSFGYEKEHYDISMQIAELVLLPAVRNQQDNVIVAATGTSCRHQIKDGAGVKALHPVEILFDALQ